MNRRKRSAVTSNNFNSARTRRANRSLPTRQKFRPKKILLVHGDPPAVEWMRGTTIEASFPDLEVIVPTPGVELELCEVAAK